MSLLDKIIVSKKLPVASTHKATMQEVDFLRLSYAVSGLEYTQGHAPDGDIIHKFECEDNKDWKLRCKQTPTRNYVSQIINKYLASVYKNEPVRPTYSAAYEELMADADGYGNSLNTVMREATKKAQVDGVSYLYAESTQTEGEIKSLAQERAANIRSYIKIIPVDSVVNTTFVEQSLIEAIVFLEDSDGKEFARYMNDEVFIDMEVDKNLVVKSMTEPYAHQWAGVPLAPIKPFDQPQSKPISYSQRNIINILSVLQQELNDSVFTKNILSGVKIDPEQENQKITWSGKRMVVLESDTAKLQQVGADPAASDALTKQINEEEKHLYTAAGFGHENATEPSNMSGYGLTILREDFNSFCDSIRHAAESAENYICGLIAEHDGYEYIPAVYSQKYIADNNGEHLQRLRDILALAVSKKFKSLMVRDYINTFYNISPEDMAVIEQELEQELA